MTENKVCMLTWLILGILVLIFIVYRYIAGRKKEKSVFQLNSRLIEQCFSEDRYIFKAQGLHENIALLKEVCSSSEKMEFNEGVNVLGYIKKYPEIIADVEDLRILKRLLSEWVSTVYERRWLIIAPEKNKSCIWKALEKNKYSYDLDINNFWGIVDCIIENIPDSPYHESFHMIFKPQFELEISNML